MGRIPPRLRKNQPKKGNSPAREGETDRNNLARGKGGAGQARHLEHKHSRLVGAVTDHATEEDRPYIEKRLYKAGILRMDRLVYLRIQIFCRIARDD